MSGKVQKGRNVPPPYRDARQHLPHRLWRHLALTVGGFALLFILVCSIAWHG